MPAVLGFGLTVVREVAALRRERALGLFRRVDADRDDAEFLARA